MELDNFQSLSFSFLKRESPAIRELLESTVGRDRTTEKYKQFKKIILHILWLINPFYLDENGNEKVRDNELDENGEAAFLIAHPRKVATLAFQLFPQDISTLPQEEQKKLEFLMTDDAREMIITAFFHDFIEDVFKGDFLKPHPKTGKTAGQTIQDFLDDPAFNIPPAVQKQIWKRIIILTKPEYEKDKTLNEEVNALLYLEHYEGYLQEIINSGDPICQYIKLIAIFQNAQSEKKHGSIVKREGKAKLQAAFIKKVFPGLAKQLLQKYPDFFEKLKDRNLVEELQQQIQNRVGDVIEEK
jgi:hypothetical protein